ncbi:MAG TPA: aldolase/citrate lyase family protein [Rhizomicrobium sp.]|nr:aldolase/citrate lyase family protein [Rhizomicrobium sp.]
MRPNRLREMWKTGKRANNCWLSIPSAFSAEIMAHQGWDSVTIDMQHAPIDDAAAYAMLVAVSTTDAVPIVRVASNEPGAILRVLDWGAYGVMCPTIETVEACRAFVGAARYAPLGARSISPGRASLYAGPDYVAKANETVLVIAQIETKLGLENVDAIAHTPGLDMLFVGPSDLGHSLGREAKPDQTDPVVVAAIDRILEAAHAAGIYAGIWCASADYGLAMMQKGFDLTTVVYDRGLLGAGAALRGKFA